MLTIPKIRQTIAQGFLVIFSLMLLNGIVFRHAHKLSSGKIITHAHPYKSSNSNSPFQPNDHTNNELFLLDMFSNVPFIGLTLTVALAAVIKSVEIIRIPRLSFYLLTAYHKPFFGDFSHRGPPSL
ncbi:hypothetical protein [Runella sp.]|uniref:hypothetical protein n=1 Tax=Runella sp. TaxID=1960881 RepID=UPI00301A63FC